MRDYSNLITALRIHEDLFNQRDAVNVATLYRDSADAIEELQAKNDKQTMMIRKQSEKTKELLAAVPKWISVEDEPPKENGRYLVRYKRDINLGDEETVREDEIRIMRFFVGEGWRYPIICNDHVRLVNEEVTHWMPLPKAPKEDKDNA